MVVGRTMCAGFVTCFDEKGEFICVSRVVSFCEKFSCFP